MSTNKMCDSVNVPVEPTEGAVAVSATLSLYSAPAAQTAAAVNVTYQVLCDDMQLLRYYKSCRKSDNESKKIIQRLAQFLVWSYNAEHNHNMNATHNVVKTWFQELMQDKYTLLLDYSTYLVEQRQLKPSTVRSYISDIERSFAWGTLFAPSDVRLPMCSNQGIQAVAEQVRLNQAQCARHVRSDRTYAAQVEQRRIPQGGLPALQDAVLKELPWARSVRHRDIDDVAYRRFVQTTVSAIYVFSANGRQSGVADVRMGQVQDLLKNGFTTTTKFKTNKKYGYQPITLSEVSAELLHLYVSLVRPQVCRQFPVQPSDHLWLTYRGETDLTIGKLVTTFFTRTCRVGVTTTAIRGLVETTMHKKYKAGEITDVQRSAVQNINGHTSEVTRDYYLLEDREEDVAQARDAFGGAFGGAYGGAFGAAFDEQQEEHELGYVEDVLADLVNGSADDDVMEYTVPPVDPLPPLSPLPRPLPLPLPLKSPRAAPLSFSLPHTATVDWGTSHPDYGTEKATAQWTQNEKQYLGSWCTRFRERFPDTNNVVARCLKHLQSDPYAVAIFHAHHTLNSARLRNGLRQYTAEAEEEQRNSALRRLTLEHDSNEMY